MPQWVIWITMSLGPGSRHSKLKGLSDAEAEWAATARVVGMKGAFSVLILVLAMHEM